MNTVSGGPLLAAEDGRPRNLLEVVHRTVTRDPDREAMWWHAADGWPRMTYGQLWERITDASLGLRRIGIGPGHRVGIVSRSRPEWLIVDFACQALGAITCPLYPGDPPARMRELLMRIGPRLVIVEDAKLLARLRGERGQAGKTTEPGTDAWPVALLDASDETGAPPTLAELGLAADRSAETMASWEAGWRAVHPAQVATVVHTMGVNGDPVGVVVSHGNLLHSCLAAAQVLPFAADDRMLSVLPLSHMFERGGANLVALALGGTIAFSERSLDRWAANMAEVRPTVMAAIPLFFIRLESRIRQGVASRPGYARALFGWATGLNRSLYRDRLAGRRSGSWHRLRRALADRTVLSPIRRRLGGRLRFFISGGARLPEETGLFFEGLGIPVLEGYGLTESAPTLTVNRPDSNRYGTVGQPVPGTELRIDEQTGEILARGPQMFLGYLDNPAATARALDAEGWLHTGDTGVLDEAGRLQITGRLKNLLVLATGKNVAPAPIEDALAASPYVRQAVLLGDDRETTGALLVLDDAAVRARLDGARSQTDGAGVNGLIRGEVDRLTDAFATFERPRRWAILPRPLDASRGELDANGRPVREVVAAHFPEQVAELFERSTP